MSEHLRVWTNDCDYVVAESADAAAAVLHEETLTPPDMTSFYACGDSRLFTFYEDGTRASEGVTKTFGEWAAERGRGYFCTAEF